MWSDIKVELLDAMGSDLDVVNAARVSFAKESGWDGTCFDPCLSDRDAKLIKYLADHNHWSPFSHCYLKFRVKAPIFVARQLQKHTVGLAWNEVSRRYVDFEPDFYKPNAWHSRPVNKKQGSGDETVELPAENLYCDSKNEEHNCDIYEFSVRSALDSYNELLERGVSPEQARMVLPQSTNTEWIWSGSLAAFARVCVLRLSSDAQRDTRIVAREIEGHLRRLFPVSAGCLLNS